MSAQKKKPHFQEKHLRSGQNSRGNLHKELKSKLAKTKRKDPYQRGLYNQTSVPNSSEGAPSNPERRARTRTHPRRSQGGNWNFSRQAQICIPDTLDGESDRGKWGQVLHDYIRELYAATHDEAQKTHEALWRIQQAAHKARREPLTGHANILRDILTTLPFSKSSWTRRHPLSTAPSAPSNRQKILRNSSLN